MTEITGAASRGGSNLTYALNGLALPFSTAWTAAMGFFGATLREVRVSPMTWTAILALAGTMSLMARSYHLGTVFVSALGILWMWQDMLDEAAKAADAPTIAVLA